MKQYLLWLDHWRGLSQQVEARWRRDLRYPSLYTYRVRGVSGDSANPHRKLEVSIPFTKTKRLLSRVRWIYYIFLMMMGVAIILQILFYRPPSFRQLHGNERTRMQEIKRVDWVGMFLIIAGLVLFLLGVSWGKDQDSKNTECLLTESVGGSPLPWSSPRILGLLISGAITLVVFGLWEAYGGAPNALVPMHFFKDVRGFSMLFIISSVSGTVYIATAIIWPSQVAYVPFSKRL